VGKRVLVGTVAVAALVVAPSASAAIRYAEPPADAPHGPSATCPESDPCSLNAAVEDVSVMDGDVIRLKPGTYTPSGSPVALGTFDALTIEPAQPGPKPLITASAATALNTPSTGSDPATVRDIRFRSTGLDGGSAAVNFSGGLLERVEAEAPGAIGINPKHGATVRDTTSWASGANGRGIVTGTNGANLRNVTTVGGDIGLDINSNFGNTQTVLVRNTIALGGGGAGGSDVEVQEGASGNITATLDHSNYDDLDTLNTPTVTESNIQPAAPVFANLGTGDFHQLAGSPTINAGTTTEPPTAGTLDFEGQPRIQGGAPDIGADEFDAAPVVSITSGPAEGETLATQSASFEFSANELVTFTCSVDGGAFETCSGPGASHALTGLANGSHSFTVRGTDGTGNVGEASRTFGVNVSSGDGADVDPPDTEIVKHPPNRTEKEKAKFTFRSDEAGSTFRCKLDKKPFKPCASPRKYKKLDEAKHKFKVKAVDPSGNVDPTPDKDTWKVLG
jgi:hypothetical protein